jgi:hypothetical protein
MRTLSLMRKTLTLGTDSVLGRRVPCRCPNKKDPEQRMLSGLSQ